MKHILLYSRHIKTGYLTYFKEVRHILATQGHKISASHILYDYLANKTKVDLKGIKRIATYTELKKAKVDKVVTLGGDGTILGATALIADLGLPILGINLGRLGFLAGVEKSSIATALAQLHDGDYRIEERSMLKLDASPELFDGLPYALNDFAVHKRDTSSMITIHTYINDEYLTSYWADGLIVATPTGSTGYSLSCGGPIIFPGAENFVITPIAPHNLNIRPLVIPNNSVVSFRIEGRTKNFLCTLDSRYEKITAQHQLAIRRCDFNTHLIILNGYSFLHTIHDKLSWGADQRN